MFSMNFVAVWDQVHVFDILAHSLRMRSMVHDILVFLSGVLAAYGKNFRRAPAVSQGYSASGYLEVQYGVERLAWEVSKVLKVAAVATDPYVVLLNGRILAELYCMLLQHVSGALPAGGGQLYKDINNLPDWGWEYDCREYLLPNPGMLELCDGLDLEEKVYKDLHFLRHHGNVSAHANLRMQHADIIGEYVDKVKLSTCRVGAVAAVWVMRLPRSRM